MKVSKGTIEVLLNCYQLSWDSYNDDFDPRHNDREIYLLKINNNNKDIFVVFNQSIYDRMTYTNDIPVVDIVLNDGTILTVYSSAKDYYYKVFNTYEEALSYVLDTENIVCDVLF